MLGVDEIGKMRRAYYREGRSIKGISRELSVSRAAVRKVLRSEAAELVYARDAAASENRFLAIGARGDFGGKRVSSEARVNRYPEVTLIGTQRCPQQEVVC